MPETRFASLLALLSPPDSERRRRSILTRFVALLGVCCALPITGIARAQDTPPANTGTLVGIVTDTLGVPMRDVSVLIASLRRQARTLEDGSFRFDGLPTGRVRVNARAIGFIGPGVDAVITRGGTTRVSFKLLRLAASLSAMTTRSSRPGLTGVVGDTTYRALEGVKVRTLGKATRTASDSVGGFNLPLTPGAYMVRLDHEGFASQTVGVHIPDDSGTKVSVLLTPQGPMNAVEIMRQVNLFDLEQRLVRASPVRYRTISREALQKFGSRDLIQAMSRSTAQRVDTEACAAINGGPDWAPLWSIAIEDIEFVEANLAGITSMPGSRGPTSINNMAARSASPTGMELSGRVGACSYVVWLRR